MANRGGSTQLKRTKERARQQKHQEKFARRLAARRQKAQAGPRALGGEDPDIAGIRPGPGSAILVMLCPEYRAQKLCLSTLLWTHSRLPALLA